jgi:diguanylate cyclase (GGDEF)-like protein
MSLVALVDANLGSVASLTLSTSIVPDFRSDTHRSAGDALTAFRRLAPNAILVSSSLGSANCLRLIADIRQTSGFEEIPIALICDIADVSTRIGAVEAGVNELINLSADALELIVRINAMIKVSISMSELERARERYNMIDENHVFVLSLLDQLPVKISATDAEGRYLLVNSAMAVAAGSSPARMVGQHAMACSVVPFVAPRNIADMQVFSNGKASRVTEFLDLGNGGAVEHLSFRSPINNMNNKRIGTVTLSVEADKSATQIADFRNEILDPITGLKDRSSLKTEVNNQIEISKSTGLIFAVHTIILCNLREINQAIGRAVGDKLLETIAGRLASALSESFRYNTSVLRGAGDMFVIIQTGVKSLEDLKLCVDCIVDDIQKPFEVVGEQIECSLHHGFCVYPNDATDIDNLLLGAKKMAYRAHADGVTHAEVADRPLIVSKVKEFVPEMLVASGFDVNQLTLYYQLQVDLKTGQTIGVETLLRWNRPGAGVMLPAKLIEFASEIGAMQDVTEWVFTHAFHDLVAFHTAGFSRLRSSINLSEADLEFIVTSDLLPQLLSQTGLKAQSIDLDLGWNGVFAQDTIEHLNMLSQLGVNITLDNRDLGLSYLHPRTLAGLQRVKLNVDSVSVRDEARIQQLQALWNNDLVLIGSHVEHADQLELLRKLDFNEVQGYYFHRPMMSQELIAMVRSGEF